MTNLDALSYTPEHEWIRIDADLARFGVTDFAADKLGDVVFVELPAVGDSIIAGEVCGEIESTKSVGELYAPVTGEVIEVNSAVVDDPSIVNSEPFDGGWLITVRIAEPAPDLLDRAAYVALTGDEA